MGFQRRATKGNVDRRGRGVFVALGVFLLGAVFLGGCLSTGFGEGGSADDPGPVSEDLARASRTRILNVGFLLGEGVYNTELTAPFDIFQHTVFHVEPGMRVFTVAPTLDVVRTFEGLRILPDYSFADCPPVDVFVVPSAEHHLDTDLENEVLIDFVRRVGREASLNLSLCDGAFVLAQAGLLDGKAATTFPADIPRFRELFAETVDVRDGVSFVHDDDAVTSIGGAESFEGALYVVELLYGSKVARGVARGLCIDWSLDEISFAVARP